jgi:hypothetical protein
MMPRYIHGGRKKNIERGCVLNLKNADDEDGKWHRVNWIEPDARPGRRPGFQEAASKQDMAGAGRA